MAGQDNNIDYVKLRENAKQAAKKAGKKASTSNSSTYIVISAVVLISAISLSLLFASSDQPHHLIQALDSSFIESLNSQGLPFTSKPNQFFQDWTLSDVKQSSQSGISQQALHLPSCLSFHSTSEPPKSFDLRDEHPSCMQEAQSQGNCSSSYSFAAASAAAERFCIASKGKVAPKLSNQQMVSCSKRNSKCSSGNIDSAWKYIQDSGLFESQYFEYASEHASVPECKEPTDETLFKVKDVCAITGEAAIMREILSSGPVVTVVQVFSDFLPYAHGVYAPSAGAVKVQGGQAVEVVGWGEEQGRKYWVVKNSWGASWGEQGYALVARGGNPIGLEDLAVSATPVLE